MLYGTPADGAIVTLASDQQGDNDSKKNREGLCQVYDGMHKFLLVHNKFWGRLNSKKGGDAPWATDLP